MILAHKLECQEPHAQVRFAWMKCCVESTSVLKSQFGRAVDFRNLLPKIR